MLIIAAKGQGGAMWSLYALLLTLAIVTFIYLSTLVAAHAVTLLVLRQARRALLGLIPAASAGLILASPVIALGFSQRKQQISWISEMRTNYPRAVLLDQWFTGSWLSVVACAIVVACGIGVLLATKGNAAWLLAVAVPWFVIPTAGLLAYSAMYENIYLARHLTFTAPGVGLLLGVCVTMVTAHRVRIIMIVLTVLALAPSLLSWGSARQTQNLAAETTLQSQVLLVPKPSRVTVSASTRSRTSRYGPWRSRTPMRSRT